MFIWNFLSNKVFRVHLGSVFSNIHTFILKINPISNVIPSSFEKSLFVDDFSISCSSRNMASIERQLQLCLRR